MITFAYFMQSLIAPTTITWIYRTTPICWFQESVFFGTRFLWLFQLFVSVFVAFKIVAATICSSKSLGYCFYKVLSNFISAFLHFSNSFKKRHDSRDVLIHSFKMQSMVKKYYIRSFNDSSNNLDRGAINKTLDIFLCASPNKPLPGSNVLF